MERGETEVCVSVRCLDTGTDWTFLSCLQNARPTKSATLWHQTKGRILRLHPPSKTDALVIDHTGSWALDDQDELSWTELDDGTGTKTARKKPGGPAKGMPEVPLHQAGEDPRVPEVRLPDPDAVEGSHHRRQTGESQRQAEEERVLHRRETGLVQRLPFRELAMRGKNPGRAFYLFRAKFGLEPRGLRKTLCEGTPEIMADVRGQIRRSDIAYARRRGNPVNISLGVAS